uniref:Zinc metalloproteinase n=1 Tax=Strongyloides venezuelensis TaxID=75913 RepID=A0A0K0F0Q1_STRVS
MKVLSEVLFALVCLHIVAGFGGLTRLRIQQKTRKDMSDDGKKRFDKHQKAMEQLTKLSNQIHNVKPSKDDDKFNMGPMSNPSLYQGDMILNKHDAEYLLAEAKMKLEAKHANKTGPDVEKEIVNKLKKNRAYRKDSRFKWKFPIHYFIDGVKSVEVIDNAFKNIEKETCLTFKKTGPFGDRQGLRLFPGQGCYSYYGPVSDNKPQDVSIGTGCEWNGIVQHEVSHALGLFHEQSRPDRDNYLDIAIQNVAPNMRSNYDKTSLSSTETFGIPYDYGSHMQYDKKAFSSNGQQTMIPKNKLYSDTMGQYDKMQFNDVKLLNTIYCSKICKGGIKCSNGGYEDPKKCGTCRCPSMLGGSTCADVAKNPPSCGKENIMTASSQEKSFSIDGVKNCVFLIKAEKNKRVKISLDKGNFNASEICFPGIALQIKFNIDKTITGPTFCGDIKPQALTSEGNEMLVNYVGKVTKNFLKFRYSLA